MAATTIQDVTNDQAKDGLLKDVFIKNKQKKSKTKKKTKPHDFNTRVFGPQT